MPRYIFAIRASNGDAPERAAELNDDAAALAYACEIARELMQGLTHADRSSLVKVRDETTKQQGGRAPCCATLAVALTLAVRRSSVTRDRVTLQRCRYRSPDQALL